nr:hypothetical protein [Tanacetum cinerariifolium]
KGHGALTGVSAVGGFLARNDVFYNQYILVSHPMYPDAWLANNILTAWLWLPQSVVLHSYCMNLHEYFGSYNPPGVVQHTLATALETSAWSCLLNISLSVSSMLVHLPLPMSPLPPLGIRFLVFTSWDLAYGKVSEAADQAFVLLKVLNSGKDFPADLEMNLFRLANFPLRLWTSLIVRGNENCSTASVLSGHGFIPSGVTMYPKNIPSTAPNVHFLGLSFMLIFRNVRNVSPISFCISASV